MGILTTAKQYDILQHKIKKEKRLTNDIPAVGNEIGALPQLQADEAYLVEGVEGEEVEGEGKEVECKDVGRGGRGQGKGRERVRR